MTESYTNKRYLKSVYGAGLSIKCLEEQIQILANIFDEKNQKICSECNFNYRYVPSHHYEIINGKRKRIYTDRTRLPDDECRGCCKGCGYNKGHYYDNNNGTKEQRSRTREIYEILKQEYHDGESFFDVTTKTCRIPRLYRSHTCLFHACSQLRLSEEEKETVAKATFIIKAIKHYLHLPY